jgi:sugar lactone lactonase YvrE
MMTRRLFVAACVALLLASTARGQFVAGHVFVSNPDWKNCGSPSFPGGDEIWEIDPQTGEVSLFVELTPEQCGIIWGLAFTPDGSRLRASLYQTHQIVEFDSDANMTVVLDADDGILSPSGSNNLAYDADGNFYVVISAQPGGKILRFPAGGGPAIVFADDDGIGNRGAIAFASDGDLYYLRRGAECRILRITPDGSVFQFDATCAMGLTGDDSGQVYVALLSGEVLRYEAGNPASKELLVPASTELRFPTITMSLDQTRVYLASQNNELFAIDVVDGTVTPVADITDAGGSAVGGIAVAPVVAPINPIPAVSEWGLIVMVLLLLTVAKVVMGRPSGKCSWVCRRVLLEGNKIGVVR